MTEVQQKILEVFKFTVSFLEKHNLRYIACAGTVLGAVRHGGFIPWDDDMDIYMPRNDYEKLKEYRYDIESLGYDLLSLEYTEGYSPSFMKISDHNSTCYYNRHDPFIMGFFVDVFPLDEFECSDAELLSFQMKYIRKFRNCGMAFKIYSFGDIITNVFHRKFSMREAVMSKIFSRKKDALREKVLSMEKSCIGNKGNKCLTLSQYPGKIFKSVWFKHPVSIKFEDTEILVPSEYDKYLAVLYGDYMKLPPLESRRGHSIGIYDLHERLSLPAIENRLRANNGK